MRIVNYLHRFFSPAIKQKAPEQAYDLWAGSYDTQTGNLMLDLDEIVFGDLLQRVDLCNKKIADIGCGTGRHWSKILSQQPSLLYGFDISDGMLLRLKEKYPKAVTKKISDDMYDDIPDGFFNTIVCTLTIAHMDNLEKIMNDWFRMLVPGGDILLTDFHPDALAKGGKRTFQYNNQFISIKNNVHSIEDIRKFATANGLQFMHLTEIPVSEKHKCYYEKKNALHVFEKFVGTPIIYGAHLKKSNATA